MAGSQCGQSIPTKLSVEQFEQFVLPHLSTGRRGPAPTLGLHKIFNYVLQLLYMGCQWKALPIEKNDEGRPEIHYTRIYRALRRWQADGCIDRIFSGSVHRLHQDQLLDLTVNWLLVFPRHRICLQVARRPVFRVARSDRVKSRISGRNE